MDCLKFGEVNYPPKPHHFHTKTTLSIRKPPSLNQNHPFPDTQKPHTKQKIRPFLPYFPLDALIIYKSTTWTSKKFDNP